MKIREYIQVKAAGGVSPDPATYCPLNGYILNPITPELGWNLLLEFETNAGSGVTFATSSTIQSGKYAWDLGDGTIAMEVSGVSHVYADSSIKTVKLYGKGTCSLSSIGLANCFIVGNVDISNNAFSAIVSLHLESNLNLTNVVLPPVMTGLMNSLWIWNTGYTGNMDLTKITTYSTTSTDIRIQTNPSLTGITFAPSVTGKINNLWIYSTGIVGVLDLSMFESFTTTTDIALNSNALMTNIIFAPIITGTITGLFIYSCGLNVTLDLSMFTVVGASINAWLNSNASLPGITFPSLSSGFIKTLRLYGNTSLGYVDMKPLKTGLTSLNWSMQSNGWSAAIVNQILVDIDGISASGFSSRILNVGGTNTDPDTTSGGYDGTAARTSLIAKAFTVTIT